MGDKSKIEWTDATWNPVTGCTKVSAGCKHCYAERHAKRFWGERKFTDVEPHRDRLDQPIRWRKPRLVFVNSMSDLFHESVSDEFIDDVFAVMALCAGVRDQCRGRNCDHEGFDCEEHGLWHPPAHTFQVLTKRPERMNRYLSDDERFQRISTAARGFWRPGEAVDEIFRKTPWPLPNVWLGISAEDQITANERLPFLLKTPAAVRFASFEPLLGPIDLALWRWYLDWVIVGGESGPGARTMHPEWARCIRDECTDNDVPFFFKQWGGVRKKEAGCELDGKTWKQMPGEFGE